MESYMIYQIKGLPLGRFAPLFGMTDAELARRGARRVVADADFGFPCRVSLEDAAAGETLVLLNHVSHDVEGPYRATHAILVREQAEDMAPLVDETPPVFDRRTLSLRGFAVNGDLVTSKVTGPGEHDRAIRELLSDARIDHIDAHNAGHGCFSARIERYMEAA
jgi:hypothetical protein